MRSVMVVEDDARIRAALQLALEEEGYEVVAVPTAEAALDTLRQATPEALLVDLMLPGMSGLDCIREVRRSSDVPIVVVSARDDTHDIVAALEVGADDYVVKPVQVKELTARLRALARRTGGAPRASQAIRLGDLEVYPDRGEVVVRSEAVALTRTEFRLLCELAAVPGQVLSRRQLLAKVWEYEFGDERLVDVHVGRLRRKVEVDPGSPVHVLTVRGLGYKLA